MLSLERLGQTHLIEDYWRVFLLFGAVIQIIDDWTDLEKDLAVGHYSLMTLNVENIHTTDPHRLTKQLKSDNKLIRATHQVSKEMIAESHAILARLNDPFLIRLVDVTDLRLDSYFRKELKFKEG